MADEWGPWIRHDGTRVPVAIGTVCQVEIRSGLVGVLTVEASRAETHGDCFIWASLLPNRRHLAIIRYRIRKPRALLDLIELVENLPAPREVVPA